MTPRTCDWLLEKSIGLGESQRSDVVLDRKSISAERTFRPISSKSDLEFTCREISEILAQDVESNLPNCTISDILKTSTGAGVSGKCLTLKLKTTDFRVRQRSLTLNRYDNLFER